MRKVKKQEYEVTTNYDELSEEAKKELGKIINLYYLKYLLKEKAITQEEYEKLKIKLEND